VKVEAEHGGEPCGVKEEEEGCNIQSCDENCILSDWTEWSSCSQACNTGTQKRTKVIEAAARGGGVCADADSEERLGFKDCNTFSCQQLLGEGRETLHCNSNVDVVIVMDGSASLGWYGWKQSTVIASNLVRALNGSAQVAFLLFSGPMTWDAYQRCTGQKKGTYDLDKDCGIQWVSHFTNDTETLAEEVSHANLEWPRRTTLTSFALGQAESELVKGRESANSVVIVITDGFPLSQANTEAAAKKLQEKAKVIWVPVGGSAPRKLIRKMASKPRKDHVISLRQFKQLSKPWALNKLVTATCPVVA